MRTIIERKCVTLWPKSNIIASWIKNVYTITNDTKVVSKIIEIILIPHLDAFAKKNGMALELPSAQNYYPDLTFKDGDGNLFAVDFKSSYYGDDRKVNGLTLGSYWGYFRNRDAKKNTDHPYNEYKCHLVIGMLYKQSVTDKNEKNIYRRADGHQVGHRTVCFLCPAEVEDCQRQDGQS